MSESPSRTTDTDLLAVHGGVPARERPIDTTVPLSPAGRAEIAALLDSGSLSAWYGGPNSHRFEEAFAGYHGPGFHAVAVNSGTSALHLALAAAGVGPGDEVIVPAACFISAASAVVQLGGVPVVCDVEPTSLTLDPVAAERLVGPRTKAVLPVHFWGYPANLPELRALCDRHGLILVEDACQAPGARVGDRRTGMYGDFAAYSFAFRKHVSTGDGGMVLTPRDESARQVRRLANLGKGEAWDEYHTLGYSYRMVELSALVGIDGMRRLDDEIARRRAAVAYYRDAFSDTGLVPIPESAWGQAIYFKLPVLLPAGSTGDRNAIVDAVGAENVSCRIPHPPLWTIDWLARYTAEHGRYRGADECPVAASLLPRLFEIETGPHLPLEEAAVSAGAVLKVWRHFRSGE